MNDPAETTCRDHGFIASQRAAAAPATAANAHPQAPTDTPTAASPGGVTLGVAELDPVDEERETKPEFEPGFELEAEVEVEDKVEVGGVTGSEVLGPSGSVVGSAPGVVDTSVWLSLVNG